MFPESTLISSEEPQVWHPGTKQGIHSVGETRIPYCRARDLSGVEIIAKLYPGWALIDIQSLSALIQRFLRFQRCSEVHQPTLILTSLIQRWTLLASIKQAKTIKTAKKMFYFHYWCWKDEKSKISANLLMRFFEKF